MFINVYDLGKKPYFGGPYMIEDRTDNSLTLSRYDFDANMDKAYNLRIFLKKWLLP